MTTTTTTTTTDDAADAADTDDVLALDVASRWRHQSFPVREEVRVHVAEPVATRVDPLTATVWRTMSTNDK